MGGMLISSNLKGWRYFFSSGLGWSVISPNLKEGKCTFIYIYIINSKKKKKKKKLAYRCFLSRNMLICVMDLWYVSL